MKEEKEKSSVGEAWDSRFDENSYKTSLKEIRQMMNSIHIRFILKYAKPGSKVLEGGCGSAKFAFALAMRGFDVTAMDYSNHIVANVEAMLASVKKERDIKLTPAKGDLTSMDYSDGSFDVVYNEGVVEHWLDRGERVQVIEEMVRVTKKGGYVVIFVPNGRHPLYSMWMRLRCPYFLDAPPMTLYDAQKLREEMEEAGLEVLETDGINAWNSLGHYPRLMPVTAAGRVLNRLPILPRGVREHWGIDLVSVGRKG